MAVFALLIIQGVLPLLLLYLMKLVVDAVSSGLTAPDRGDSFRQVALLIGLTGAVTLVAAAVRSMAGLVNETQSQVVTNYMYDVLHTKALAVDLAYYENSQYYDTLHRAQQEAPYRPTSILNGVVQVGQNGISLLAITGLLLSFHWAVAVVVFIAAIPDVFVRVIYSNKMYHWQRQRTSIGRRAWYFDWLLTRDTHAKEIRLFDLGKLFRDRFRDLRRQLLQEGLAIATWRSIAGLASQTVATLAVFGCYAFIAYRTIRGAATVGDLVMYYQAFQRGQEFLQGMLAGVANLYEGNLFLANLFEFLDLKPNVIDPLQPEPIPRPLNAGIAFDHVSFQYPSDNRKILDDITLTIRPGEHVALVGENGSGKTTLIKLLCRLYDPTSGNITLDGIDLRRFETAALRRQISVMFQDYAHYQLTARENIWLGNVELSPDQEEIAAAARCSGAHDVIAGLPHGYETTLGKWFENGAELSIGEWQRIALARAFLRDAQIIILDEPSSALDAKAEYELFQKFHELAKGRTAILISHRLSTVRMADRIYFLTDGKLTESGCHEELVKRNRMYAQLFEMQAQNYR
jgi:ATP-binding cassette subfamily B protein